MLITACGGQHPGTARERRLMTDMLPVPASQIGNPIALVVLMIADNRLVHGREGISGFSTECLLIYSLAIFDSLVIFAAMNDATSSQ